MCWILFVCLTAALTLAELVWKRGNGTLRKITPSLLILNTHQLLWFKDRWTCFSTWLHYSPKWSIFWIDVDFAKNFSGFASFFSLSFNWNVFSFFVCLTDWLFSLSNYSLFKRLDLSFKIWSDKTWKIDLLSALLSCYLTLSPVIHIIPLLALFRSHTAGNTHIVTHTA